MPLVGQKWEGSGFPKFHILDIVGTFFSKIFPFFEQGGWEYHQISSHEHEGGGGGGENTTIF